MRARRIANRRMAAVAALSLFAYAPFFLNGFISDDWVVLERASRLAAEPLYLFATPPEQFRLTTYLAFFFLKAVFEYTAAGYYAFAWLLHLFNTYLVGRLAEGFGLGRRSAWFAMAFFAVIQNPHEAVAWLSAMNESLMALFSLLSLLAWRKGRRGLAAALWLAALFSKESALIIPVFIALGDWIESRRLPQWRNYRVLLAPAGLFAAAFIQAFSGHSMLREGYYAFGPHALPVLAWSLHRLAFPYFYLAVMIAAAGRGEIPKRCLAALLACCALAMLPYAFLTYQGQIASRQTYLACVPLCLALALLTRRVRIAWLRLGFLGIFLLGNASYLWLVKDAQFESRAAPTAELRLLLENRRPEPLVVEGFPLNPWAAKLTARAVEGWSPEQIILDARSCPDCPRVRWRGESRRYVEE